MTSPPLYFIFLAKLIKKAVEKDYSTAKYRLTIDTWDPNYRAPFFLLGASH